MQIKLNEKQKQLMDTEFSWVDISNEEFALALNKIINTNENICICAPGGTGKSVLLKVAAKLLDGNTVVLSTTGVSAANLAGEGIATSTVHSFFRLPPLTVIDEPILYADLSPVMQKIDTLLIDEVSMLNASVFDTIIKLLKRYRVFEAEKLPRLILFGDVLQLPPVIEKDNTIVQQLFERKYNGHYMFFHADEYKSLCCTVCHLNHIYRQNDDNWKSILNRIREGVQTQADLDLLNTRVVNERAFIEEHDTMMYLATTNNRVQALNEFYLDTDNSRTYKAIIEGKYDIKGTNHKAVVDIAPGMQVMCNHNNKQLHYSNGTLGHVTRVTPTTVIIRTKDNDSVKVEYEKWEQYQYSYNREKDVVEHNTTGSFTQIGCVPAFSVTIHKSQGLTLDALLLDPTGLHYMGPSLAYVTLSRCTSLEGIGLTKPIRMCDIKTNEDGLRFLEENV